VRRLVTLAAVIASLCCASAAAAGSPRVAIFFYPWYSTAAHDGSDAHWNQAGHSPPGDVASSFLPLRGAYSSADTAVLRAQLAEIAGTGAGVVVSSWWGSGSTEDVRLPAIIDAARASGLRVAVQVEPYAGRTPASVAADIERLRALDVTDFYVYRAQDSSAADWAEAIGGQTGVRLFAHTSLVGWAASAGFTGVYTYDVLINSGSTFARLCRQAHRVRLLCAPSVGPGFDATAATPELRTRPRLAGATYDTLWQAAVAAAPDVVTITSYNEWHEGSQIEPAAPSPQPGRYQDYEGAWGLHGAQATTAYLARTALWVQRFDPAVAAVQPAAVARILAAWPETLSPPGRRTFRTR
jgi:glycoprotein endo-alpha-1,2-mannosidase